MAKGAPDYFNVVDIALQDLARVVNRPTYGGAKVSIFQGTATANADTLLFSISGTGMLYGGCIYITCTATQKSGIWYNVCDGNPQCPVTLNILNEARMVMPHGTSPILTRFDEVNFVYGCIIPYGITFESSFVSYWREQDGNTPNVVAVMTYGMVS